MRAFEFFCTTCGVTGEENFSKNDFGESVCNICGTQNHQQSRIEVLDEDDVFGQGLNISIRRRNIRRGRKLRVVAEKEKKPLVTLENCLHVTQTILSMQAEALAELIHDQELPNIVRELWFHFLECWNVKGARPLLNCFISMVIAKEKPADALQADGYEAQWNLRITEAEFEDSQLSKFSLQSHIAILYLACRLRHNGIVIGDLISFIVHGQIPYGSVLSLLPEEMQISMAPIAVSYFNTNLYQARITTTAISTEVNYLHYHLDLKLPPLNWSLALTNFTKALNLPKQVQTNYHRLCLVLAPDEYPALEGNDKRLLLLPSELDFVARLAMSIKLCPSWHLWTYNSNENYQGMRLTLNPYDRKPVLKRKHLNAFVDVVDNNRHGRFLHVSMPAAFDGHIEHLQELASTDNTADTIASNPVTAFAPQHSSVGAPIDPGMKNGQLTMPSDIKATHFYPFYQNVDMRMTNLHGAMENLIDLIAEYMDMSRFTVLESICRLEKVVLPHLRV
ncbi:hypothetical protein THRCLA_07001, partial [Thraustotheca clavata]